MARPSPLPLAALAALALLGCEAAPASGGLCEPVITLRRTAQGSPTIDLIVVLDEADSLAEERAQVLEQLPAVIDDLHAGRWRDPERGEVLGRFLGYPEIRLAVVTPSSGEEGRLERLHALGNDLAVLVLSDGDGLSALEPLFPASADRAAEDLLEAAGAPGRLTFGVIGGLPADLEVDARDGSLAAALADPRMQAELGEPACAGEGGPAAPSRGLLEIASGVAGEGRAAVLVRSVCAPSLRPALLAFAAAVAREEALDCIGRPLLPDAEGSVDCHVVERLEVGERCEDRPGREPLLDGAGEPVSTSEGRPFCLERQISAAALRAHLTEGAPDPGPGWFYAEEAILSFSCGAGEPTLGSWGLGRRGEVRFECCAPAVDCERWMCEERCEALGEC